DEQELAAALELVEHRRERVEVGERRRGDADAGEAVPRPVERERAQTAARRGHRGERALVVGGPERLGLLGWQLVDAERRRQRDDRDRDAVAVELGQAALEPVRVRLQVVVAVGKPQRPAVEPRRLAPPAELLEQLDRPEMPVQVVGRVHDRTSTTSPSSAARRSTNSSSSSSTASSSGGRSYASRSSRQRARARAAWSGAPFRVQRSKLSVVATVGRQKQSRKRARVCCAPKKCPPWPTSTCASKARLASSTSSLANWWIIRSSSSQSAANFSNDVTRPPSSQPADCQHTFAPARNAAPSVFIAS